MEMIFIFGISVLSRIIPHIPNMTPVGAMALFTGSKYRLSIAVCIVGLSMLCSDALLGFHSVMWATYGSFFVAILLGRVIKKQQNWKFIGMITLLSSFQFFILTNTAVWLNGFMYPKTPAGLIQCFVMALPFFRNSLIGDLLYTIVIFGCSYCVRRTTVFVFQKEYLS